MMHDTPTLNRAAGARTPATSTLATWQPLTQQQAFRQLMTAFSYPGQRVDLPAAGGDALTQLLATLLDSATTLADPQQRVADDDLRRLAVPMVAPEQAQFVVTDGGVPPAFQPALGTLEGPETGATVILAVQSLQAGALLRLRGPGIPDERLLHVTGVDPDWWLQRQRWNSGFPLGVDMVLVADQQLAALPRTTRIDFLGAH